MADVRIRSARKGYRRGGVEFKSTDWVVVSARKLSAASRRSLLADPLITVEFGDAKADTWSPADPDDVHAARTAGHQKGPLPPPPGALFRYEIRGPEDCTKMAVAVAKYIEAHPDTRPAVEEAMRAAFPLHVVDLDAPRTAAASVSEAAASTDSEGGEAAPAASEFPAKSGRAKSVPAEGAAAGDTAASDDSPPGDEEAAEGGAGGAEG